jgi:hypothetical protein
MVSRVCGDEPESCAGRERLQRRRPAPSADLQLVHNWILTAQESPACNEKLIEPVIKRKYFVSDLSRLNYPLMREMLLQIRQRAVTSGLPKVPVVLTNHPKDIRDWAGLERFVAKRQKLTMSSSSRWLSWLRNKQRRVSGKEVNRICLSLYAALRRTCVSLRLTTDVRNFLRLRLLRSLPA